MTTCLIVDDEPMARVHLRHLLESLGERVIGEADNAATALQMAEDLRPDLLFLDIRMPGLSGMQAADVLLHLEPAPLVVFVTGFSEHAAQAFEQDTLDYIVKPVSAERLAKTLARARARLADAGARAAAARSVQSLAGQMPLRRLPIRGDYAVRLVRVEEILYAAAREKRVFVRTQDSGEYRTYYTLTYLESVLPQEQFLRIHDSYIVLVDAVEELLFLGNHAYEIRLTDGQRLPVGRTRYPELQRRLGLDSALS